MSTDAVLAKRSHEENWLPILELAIEEVFEIMLGCQVKPIKESPPEVTGEFTAMVGLAGALCGILTVCCNAESARQIAKAMLGDTADSEDQVADALGEICNMITGNFESGSAQMKSTSQAAFDRIATLLREHNDRLRIEGHTDNVPIHTSQFPSNWELSTSRATEIVRLLIVRDGFPPNLLSAAGYGEYHPVVSNSSGEGRGMNRRVDIIILGGSSTEAVVAAGIQAQMPTQAPAEVSVVANPGRPPPVAPPKPSALIPSAQRLQR